MAKTLQSQGLTTERFRQKLREQFIVEAMRNKFISSEIIISPLKVQTWYDANKEQFKVEDQYKLRMISVNKNDPATPNPKRFAEELLVKVKDGTPFTELAAMYSPRAPRGDGSEWYERSQLRKELAEAVGTLKAGQTTTVVETPDSYYLAYVEEFKPAHVKPLNEVRTTIENNLTLEERNRLEKQWVDRLKKKTFVRYY
jgi:peptidyl-prolyl cis-trans isomerase SurA